MSENLKYLTPELFLVIFNLSFLCVMLFVKSSAILLQFSKMADDLTKSITHKKPKLNITRNNSGVKYFKFSDIRGQFKICK